MQWAGISIEVETSAAEEAVTHLLTEAGCAGVALAGDGRLVTSYLPNDDRLDARLRQIRAALSLLATLGIDGVNPEPMVQMVDEEDWATAWKKYFKPTRVGRRLVVTPPWETPDLAPDDLPLVIDPGMAFGTGSHPTTRMCLILLEDYVRPGDAVADIGTGSGILAIAAKKLGADSVVAIDNDPLAVKIAGENAVVNRTQIEFGEAFPISELFDVIVANILADPIIAMADDFMEILKPGGVLILSGIIDTRENDVRFASEMAGASSLETLREGEWVALALRRASS